MNMSALQGSILDDIAYQEKRTELVALTVTSQPSNIGVNWGTWKISRSQS